MEKRYEAARENVVVDEVRIKDQSSMLIDKNIDMESFGAASLMLMFVCMCVCVDVCDGDSLCQGIFHSHCCIQKQMQYR